MPFLPVLAATYADQNCAPTPPLLEPLNIRVELRLRLADVDVLERLPIRFAEDVRQVVVSIDEQRLAVDGEGFFRDDDVGGLGL